LAVGDYVVVTKWSYGYGRYSLAPLEGLLPHGRVFAQTPERGDVVVFRPPLEPNKDYIKRVIGLPGDRIQMREGVVLINGRPVERERVGLTDACPGDRSSEATAYRETLDNGVSYLTCDKGMTQWDNTRVYVVPDGHYFMMGDDRDNSADSRVPGEVGFVPFDHLVGPAQFVVVSFRDGSSILAPWTLITGFRGDRFMRPVN
jgi:signal peptidase I